MRILHVQASRSLTHALLVWSLVIRVGLFSSACSSEPSLESSREAARPDMDEPATEEPSVDDNVPDPGETEAPETPTRVDAGVEVEENPITPDPPEPPPPSSPSDATQGHPRRFVLADEPLRKILYVNLDDPSKDWDLALPLGARDLQLIGRSRLLVGTLEGSGGYYEIDLTTGKIVDSALGFGRVLSARRLPNGNTLLIGLALKGGKGTVVLELDAQKQIVKTIEFPALTGGRLIRRTASGNFLIGSAQPSKPGKDVMVEITPDGKEVARFEVSAQPAYMGLRMPNGDTLVANGHGASLLVFDPNQKLKLTIGGPRAPEAKEIRANHFSQFQVLRNGHYVITNWQGHEKTHGADGKQVIEYDEKGQLVWAWEQDPKRISSIHGVIVLDGLDLEKLHDDVNGVLAPVP